MRKASTRLRERHLARSISVLFLMIQFTRPCKVRAPNRCVNNSIWARKWWTLQKEVYIHAPIPHSGDDNPRGQIKFGCQQLHLGTKVRDATKDVYIHAPIPHSGDDNPRGYVNNSIRARKWWTLQKTCTYMHQFLILAMTTHEDR